MLSRGALIGGVVYLAVANVATNLRLTLALLPMVAVALSFVAQRVLGARPPRPA